MKYALAILTAAMVVAFTGCVLKGKPAAPAPAFVTPKPPVPPPAPATPPPPLSEPQTKVELPAPQPITDEAKLTTEIPGEPSTPDLPNPRPQRGKGAAAAKPKPEATPPAPQPPAAGPPAEPEARAPIQEIVSPEDLARLQNAANQKKQEIKRLLARVSRHPTPEQKGIVQSIEGFVAASDEAERAGDMRKAFETADRGLLLAQSLANAK
jgi:hypothetical protein